MTREQPNTNDQGLIDLQALDDGIDLPPLRVPFRVGDPPDDDAHPLETPPVLEVPAHVREAWEALWHEKGRKPTRREMAAQVGGGSSPRNAWCRLLEAEARQALPEADAVTTCRDALQHATQAYEAWTETCREAEAEVARCLTTWRNLEQQRLTSDAVSLNDVQAAIEAHRVAEVRATQVLPPLGPALETAVVAATGALEAAIVEAHRQRYNALGAQRRTLILGPLEATKEAFVEELHSVLDTIHAQHELMLALGLPPGEAIQHLSFWLYGTLADVVPYPPRDRYFYNTFPRVDALADADTSLQPVSADELPQVRRTTRRWVQYHGPDRPNFTWAGLEQLRQNSLNERNFQQGKAIEVSAAEEQVLREHYGAAIVRTIPPVWP